MGEKENFLTREQVRTFYDQFGSKQDAQQWYELKATRELLNSIDFSQMCSILEFGFGTGTFAMRLLDQHYERGFYVGVELSATMVSLATRKLRSHESRVSLLQINGHVPLPFKSQVFDLFVSNYVFDLLSPRQIRRMVAEAERLLKPGGVIGLVSLGPGVGFVSRMISTLSKTVHSWRPRWVGGCRPIDLRPFFSSDSWRVDFYRSLSVWGIPSTVLIAFKD